jgi:single-stranded-DNA-specific exonuclease
MRWIFSHADPVAAARLSEELRIAPVVARILLQRGITDSAAAQKFLDPRIEHLHSPYLMSGMRAAVARLSAAIERKEKTLIYGDYDVDGTVAIVILKAAIEILGGTAEFHVPHRIRDGYGMKDDVIEQAAAAGVSLIISVDTGIRAFAAAETARRVGVDLIVTDHHLTESGRVPDAIAVLNPNQPGCEYPCKELCGAGVAFKIAQALLEAADRQNLLPSFLKMVAIATVSDAVPLVGENRVITRLGLDGLRDPRNPGLKELLRVADLEGGRIMSAGDVGFRLGPRLNAAGRMDVASDVIELFTTRDATRARELAERLNKLNGERQQEEARIVESIRKLLDGDAALREPYCLVLDGDGWHRGVIGIVATRVVERYGRPALIVSRDENTGEAHGSGRSIPVFHLLDALEEASCRHLFTRFGGHAHAVGFALPIANIAPLRSAIDAYARARLQAADFEPLLLLDGELSAENISPRLLEALIQLAPFGLGNREPVFALKSATLKQEPRILKERHLKLRIGSAAVNGKCFDALGWRMAERVQASPLAPGAVLDLAFTLEQDGMPEFPGLQLVLKDFRVAANSENVMPVLQAAAH